MYTSEISLVKYYYFERARTKGGERLDSKTVSWEIRAGFLLSTKWKFFRRFNVKLGRQDIFKPTTGNESLHQGGNDNSVKIVTFAT
jgi:hypothetical protein